MFHIHAYTTAPWPRLVEFDASCCRIRAMLSQRQRTPGKLHLCAFFSQKLTPGEDNYDMWNHEQLSIKEALEEWRHWLEGACHSFQLLKDHINLEYKKNDSTFWWPSMAMDVRRCIDTCCVCAQAHISCQLPAFRNCFRCHYSLGLT